MKISKLTDHLKFEHANISIPSTRDEPQLNIEQKQTCLVLLASKPLGRAMLKLLPNRETTLVILCGEDKALRDCQPQFSSDLTQAKTIAGLLGILDDVVNCICSAVAKMETQLKAVYISNISMFYWDLQVSTDENYEQLGFHAYVPQSNIFHKLSALLKQIALKYRCPVMVVGYDSTFDSGIAAPKHYSSSEIQKYSKLPTSFLESFDHLIHRTASKVEVFDKEQNRWT
ncbi:uncharacterized protein LODBEIA_P02910 [Lodderomyces beijingensis]|uniref:Uncharacterized protein n=1 Tax=Lodderomyces beijingensis TaxID=1775926 RepID=A0ABP0ZF36_9ASCO